MNVPYQFNKYPLLSFNRMPDYSCTFTFINNPGRQLDPINNDPMVSYWIRGLGHAIAAGTFSETL